MPKYILYIQTPMEKGREKYEYGSARDYFQGITHCYEDYLKQSNPQKSRTSYQIKDLLNFILTVPIIGCLISQSKNEYVSKDRRWIERNMRSLLKHLADKQGCGVTANDPILL